MCGCIHDEPKTLITTIDSRQHADATRTCVRWSSSAARGWGMPTNAGAAHSAHGGDRHRYIVGAAPRTAACVRTSCFADNRPHAALFLAPAWACNHRHLRLPLHVPLEPAVPEPATHTHALGRHYPQTWHVRQRKPASLRGCARMCTAQALPRAHLPMPAAGKSAQQPGWNSTARDPWCPPRPGGALQHHWVPPWPLPLPLRWLSALHARCKKLG